MKAICFAVINQVPSIISINPLTLLFYIAKSMSFWTCTSIRRRLRLKSPSNAINSQLKKYFEEASGITVEIEVLPLEQVLQKLTLDIASQLGTYDLYYIDQSWAFRTAGRLR